MSIDRSTKKIDFVAKTNKEIRVTCREKEFNSVIMEWFIFVVLFCAGHISALRYIQVTNQNTFPIWIQTQPNSDQPPLTNQIIQIMPGGGTVYNVQDSGWGGRLWPKVGCDGNGANCVFGQSVAPCPNGGCEPPAETKVEFFFPPINTANDSFYDISLVSFKIKNLTIFTCSTENSKLTSIFLNF